jgi:hypothetical protein
MFNCIFSSLSPLSSPYSVITPHKQNIMRDKWMNIGYEEEELKPFTEPPKDLNDPARIGNSSSSDSPQLQTIPCLTCCHVLTISISLIITHVAINTCLVLRI